MHLVDTHHPSGGLAPLFIGLQRDAGRVDTGLGNGSHHHGHTGNGGLVADLHMPVKDGSAANDTVFADLETTSHSGRTRDGGTVTDFDVVSDLALVIDDNVVGDAGMRAGGGGAECGPATVPWGWVKFFLLGSSSI